MPDAVVECATTKGPITIELHRDWAPLGYARFVELVERGFFGDGSVGRGMPLFRCVKGFLCQFGYNARKAEFGRIADDPMPQPKPRFRRGFVSYAGNGKDSRSNHLFVTLGANVESLGVEPWETPIGFVTEESMEAVVAKWETGYGDMSPW
jgi:cyclophilin family peptidyl-prolyl cis-trans isomerase